MTTDELRRAMLRCEMLDGEQASKYIVLDVGRYTKLVKKAHSYDIYRAHLQDEYKKGIYIGAYEEKIFEIEKDEKIEGERYGV